MPGHRLDDLGIGFELERRDEPGRPQHPQRIVEERHLDRDGRPQPAGGEIGEAVERVDEIELRKRERHRVDGEVASREVGLDVVAEDDLGLAALGQVDVGPERGDLEAQALALRADGAEALALEPQVLGPAVEHRLDRIGTRVGREVDVVARQLPSGDRVAQPSTDEVEGVAGTREARRELHQRRVVVQVRRKTRGSFAVTPRFSRVRGSRSLICSFAPAGVSRRSRRLRPPRACAAR